MIVKKLMNELQNQWMIEKNYKSMNRCILKVSNIPMSGWMDKGYKKVEASIELMNYISRVLLKKMNLRIHKRLKM